MGSATAEASGLIYVLALGMAGLVCMRAHSLGSWLKVMAHPDSERKRHKRATPQIGGVAILSALVVWLVDILCLGNGQDHQVLTALLFCAMGVGLVGFTDDQHNTSPLSRILSLIVFLGIAVVLDPSLITTHLHWASFDAGVLPVWVYCLVTGFAVLGLVNAVNMADGQDGVVGSMFVVWSICLIVVTQGPVQGLAGMMLGASALFLAFNLAGKLFMGDCGTYGVTFLFAMLAVGVHARGQLPLETIVVWFFIPVVDCLRLLITRPLSGRSPFDGDRDHFHHRLEDKLGKRWGLVAYAGAVAASSFIATMDEKFALLSLAMLSAFYFSFAWLTDTASVAARLGKSSGSNVVSIGGTKNSGTQD